MEIFLFQFAVNLGLSMFAVTFVSMSIVDIILQKLMNKEKLDTYFSLLKWIELFEKYGIGKRIQRCLKQFDEKIAKENNLV